jgi:ATP-dependent exoDNAse (exonuclease V) beta subunit
LLYVTLTRAIEQLYIITEYKITKSGENTGFYSGLFINYLKSLNKWDPTNLLYTFGEKSRVILEKNEEKSEKPSIEVVTSTTFISTDISEHQVSLYAKSATLWGTEQGEAITYGNLIHELLAHIHTLDDVDIVLKRFINQGTINEEEQKILKTILVKVVNNKHLISYFQQNLTIYNERELVNALGVSLIPDRVVVLPNKKVVIIDYKTGAVEKKHQAQVINYATYYSEMGYDVVEKLLVYIGEESVNVVSITK